MIPLQKHLIGYTPQTLIPDALAGLVVGMVTIPQAIAYALLAGVPPEAGLYACLLPMVLYAATGSSKHLVVGPVAIAALMIVSTVSEYAPRFSSDYLSITNIICVQVALIFAFLRFLRLGALVNLISHPVLTGFINAAVVLIIISQLPILTGMETGKDLSPLSSFLKTLEQANDFNLLSIGLGLLSLLFLAVFSAAIKMTNPNKSKEEASQPNHLFIGLGPIFLVSTSIFLVYFFEGTHVVETVGHIPSGLPALVIPEFDRGLWVALLPASLIIAMVTYIESFSIATALATKENTKIDSHQELMALSIANLGAGFTGAYPVAGSFSRSSVNYNAGAKTPISSLVCAAIIVLSLVFFTELFALLPLTVLAAIVIISALSLFDFKSLYESWGIQKSDAVSEIATFLGVLILGVELGLLLGVFLSVAFFLRQAGNPKIVTVGRLPGTEYFRSNERYQVETSPGTLMVRIDENIFFASTENIEVTLMSMADKSQSLKNLLVVCSAVNIIDTTGLQMLSRLSSHLKRNNTSLHLSDLKGTLLSRLDQTHIENRISGKVFVTANQGLEYLALADDQKILLINQ